MQSFKQWLIDLEPINIADSSLRLVTIFSLSIWLFFHGMIYQESYGLKLVELNMYPWWNILLVALVAAGAIWCPRVGILAALAVFLYLSDMDILSQSSHDMEFMRNVEEYFVGGGGSDAANSK
jgi:hypothetical protein